MICFYVESIDLFMIIGFDVSIDLSNTLCHSWYTSDTKSQKIASGGRFWNVVPDAWFWNIAPDVWFQNIAPDARQTPARRNISKSGVRRKISKSCARHYILWPCVRRAVRVWLFSSNRNQNTTPVLDYLCRVSTLQKRYIRRNIGNDSITSSGIVYFSGCGSSSLGSLITWKSQMHRKAKINGILMNSTKLFWKI